MRCSRLVQLLFVIIPLALLATSCQPVYPIEKVIHDRSAIKLAFEKVQTAPSMRVHMILRFDKQVVLEVRNEANQGDQYTNIQGLFLAQLALPDGSALEMITVDDRYFIKGPIAKIQALENKWYEIAQPVMADPTKGVIQAEIRDLLASDSTLVKMERLDEQQCTVYLATSAVNEKVVATTNEKGAQRGSKSEVIDAEVEFTICNDGYLHRLVMTTIIVSKDDPVNHKTSITEIHYFDFGEEIQVEAPAEAERLF